jgi:hypothetical protein
VPEALRILERAGIGNPPVEGDELPRRKRRHKTETLRPPKSRAGSG